VSASRSARERLFGLLAPNGAGKTTTIKMLITLLLPTSGSASVLGHDVVSQAHEVRRRIGYVFGGERGLYERVPAIETCAISRSCTASPLVSSAGGSTRCWTWSACAGASDVEQVACVAVPSNEPQRLSLTASADQHRRVGPVRRCRAGVRALQLHSAPPKRRVDARPHLMGEAQRVFEILEPLTGRRQRQSQLHGLLLEIAGPYAEPRPTAAEDVERGDRLDQQRSRPVGDRGDPGAVARDHSPLR
jgi:hypothetical protein